MDGGVMFKVVMVLVEVFRKEKMGRVMVVEDNVINCRVLGVFLKKRVSLKVGEFYVVCWLCLGFWICRGSGWIGRCGVFWECIF